MLTPFSARSRAGFTLIELLTVIAIIAILTAIILPVFATVEENARQQSSISNLHQIQTGLAQFKLDQGQYPPVLFGYAYPGQGMTTALQAAEAKNDAAQYFPGLYPEYVKDPLVFTDANNTVSSLTATTAALPTNSLTAVGTTGQNDSLTTTTTSPTGVPTIFYQADAYDTSPQIGSANEFTPSNGSPTYVVRYQLNWLGIGTSGTTNYANDVDYTRQLRWQNPPADTYVTCTTEHVPNDNKVIVLWESGDAQVIDLTRFWGGGAGGGSDSPSATGAKFWRVSPTNPANP